MSVEQNLAPISTPAAGDGVARIIGGVGGIRFQWQELERGAQLVSAAAEELAYVAEVVAGMGVRLSALQVLSQGSDAANAASGAIGAAAAEAVSLARQRVLDCSSELSGVGDRIRWSRLAYEGADAAVRGLLGDFRMGVGPLGPMPPIAAPLTVEHIRTETTRMDGTVDSLLAQVSHTTDEPGNAFEVLEVHGQDGPTYVVVIPGSEGSDWEHPFSFYGIGEARYGNSEYVHDAIVHALEEVGAKADADVVLVGYSQGGMHAMNLANSGSLPERYSVELVVTAGSPVEREEAPEGTSFLHLAHAWDAVPHADLLPHEDRPNQVSVVFDHHTGLDEGEEFGLGPAHKIDSYREGARAVDMSTHPSIAPITAALGTAVAGSAARRHVFQVTRPPLIGPQPAPSAAPPSERKGREVLAPRTGDRSRDK